MTVILDTSAVIAYLLNEAGSEMVAAALDDAMIAAPNAAEIISILMRRGSSESAAIGALRQLEMQVVPLDEALALRTGSIIAATRSQGLSLGDCACLALALDRNAEVLSTDRQWTKTGLSIRVTLIR